MAELKTATVLMVCTDREFKLGLEPPTSHQLRPLLNEGARSESKALCTYSRSEYNASDLRAEEGQRSVMVQIEEVGDIHCMGMNW